MNAVSHISHYGWFFFQSKQGIKDILKLFLILLFLLRFSNRWSLELWLATSPEYTTLWWRNSPIVFLYKVNQFYKLRSCCHSEYGTELVSAGLHLSGLVTFLKNIIILPHCKVFCFINYMFWDGKISIIYKKPLLSIDKKTIYRELQNRMFLSSYHWQ